MRVFVFGCKTGSLHQSGTAKTARDEWGAVPGVDSGFQRTLRDKAAYAIPVRDKWSQKMSLASIAGEVWGFLDFARTHPDYVFYLTRLGTGLNMHREDKLIEMFREMPENVIAPVGWRRYLDNAVQRNRKPDPDYLDR